MEIRILHSQDVGDFATLIQIFREVFENKGELPGESYLVNLLKNPGFMVVVAKINGKVTGGLTVYILNGYYNEKPTAYIYDVGVDPAFQRQGIGKKLIAFLTTYCRENGFQEAYVEAESDDEQAIGFYRKTPFTGELQATHFTCSFSGK
jgi:aminoglycoside 3-N-acetyltransferase I